MIRQFTDQMNREIEVSWPPHRIISLVPSQTELLYDLGLDEEVVGLTKFCVHPNHWYRKKNRIGGTKNIHIDRIDDLQPDLIIGNKEENTPADVHHLADRYPVWLSDIYTLQDAFSMMTQIGALCDRTQKARALVDTCRQSFAQIPIPERSPRTLYLIWRKPYMAAASHTFIDAMLSAAGFTNVLRKQERYPELSEQEIAQLAPDLILLSSEPFPFREKHIEALQQIVPGAHIALVDGEVFSWYGSRLLHAPAYFQRLHQRLGLRD